MGQSLAAILIGAAGLLVLIIYRISEERQIERFRKELIDGFAQNSEEKEEKR